MKNNKSTATPKPSSAKIDIIGKGRLPKAMNKLVVTDRVEPPPPPQEQELDKSSSK